MIARVALIETTLENIALWYADVTHIEMTYLINNKFHSLCPLKHSDSKSCPYRNSTGNHCDMVPRCHPYRNDILTIDCTVVFAKTYIVIATTTLRETAVENIALWYLDVMTHTEMTPQRHLHMQFVFAKTSSDSKSCPYRNSTGKHCIIDLLYSYVTHIEMTS